MSDETETPKRLRTPNPLTVYKKAKALADRARRAHARADELAEKAKEAADKAAALAERKDEYEADEQVALEALKAEIEGLDTDTDEVADEDEEGDE